MLPDGTFAALENALDEARKAGKPFSVVHFDGHGVYHPDLGLGMLCFEDASDAEQGLLKRKSELVGADRLGALLLERRVPLCVLEACQSAQADAGVESSVAAGLLKAGVGSVVAMSHAVLVETAKRFTGAFYSSLAEGQRIGEAMNRATQFLRNQRNRAGEHSDEVIELHDWMVPVLFQEPGGDIAFFASTTRPNEESLRRQQAVRLGSLPDEPPHGFIGRERSLMSLHRLLRPKTAIALTGPGGQGKTALARTTARWFSDIRQVERIAFVSVEHITALPAILDAIGTQLLPDYRAVIASGLGSAEQQHEKALLPILGALQQRPILLVIDNLETLLPAPDQPIPPETTTLLTLLERLRQSGQTRILLTSRQALPPGLKHQPWEVPRLSEREGTQLVRYIAMRQTHARLTAEQKGRVADLVKQVNGHARALVLLAPLVLEQGAALTLERVRQEMERLERLHPGERENSLLASVHLSLARLPAKEREQVKALGVFKAVVPLPTLGGILELNVEPTMELAARLVEQGLATLDSFYLLPDPALLSAVRTELSPEQLQHDTDRWFVGMVGLIRFLYEQRSQDAQLASHGTRTAVVELVATLEEAVQRVEGGTFPVEDAVEVATALEQLISVLALPRFLTRVEALRQSLRARLGHPPRH